MGALHQNRQVDVDVDGRGKVMERISDEGREERRMKEERGGEQKVRLTTFRVPMNIPV